VQQVSLKRTLTLALFLAYLSTVILANWAVTTYGVVPVGFGLMAPAGVYVVGIAFTLRDLLHETGGRWLVLGAIAIGAVLSVLVATPALAVASGVAFTVSEVADLLVYEPLRRKGWLGAVAASNAVGLVIDSIVFLVIAFGSLQFLAGQVVGKAWMTLLAVAVLAAGRAAWRRRKAAGDLGSKVRP
jgi:queuosine precursor transporter